MQERANRLRAMFGGEGIDAFLIARPENRYYITGFTGSSGTVLITGTDIYLMTDFRYDEQAKIQSPQCQVIMVREDIPHTLQDLVIKNNIKALGCEGDFITCQQYSALEEKLTSTEIKPLYGFVEKLRIVKEQVEINKITSAVRLADKAFRHIIPFLREGIKENDIALELELYMRRNGAEGISFPIILASGHRSSLPHGLASEKVLTRGDLVTMDFGALMDGYSSDMTRTVVLGEPDKKQEEIYNIVLEAQLAGISAVKPGIPASEVDRVTRDVIVGYGYGEYFGHGTGHGLGLQIHENPRLSAKDNTELAPGMVVTVEPGIYLPGWGGVRIEDTVLVTDNGVLVLSESEKDRLIVC